MTNAQNIVVIGSGHLLSILAENDLLRAENARLRAALAWYLEDDKHLTTERLKTSETAPPTPRSRSRRRSNPKNQRLQSDLVLLSAANSRKE